MGHVNRGGSESNNKSTIQKTDCLNPEGFDVTNMSTYFNQLSRNSVLVPTTPLSMFTYCLI